MRQSILIFFMALMIDGTGCKKDDPGPVADVGPLPSATTTIGGSTANGFSFSQGKILVRPFDTNSWPDFEIYFETGSGGPLALGFYFIGTKPDGSF